MARYDKYDPIAGGFRAQLNADFALGTPVNGVFPNLGKVFAVGLNTSGKVVLGAGNAGVVGVLILTEQKFAGDVVDIMTHGEIVDLANSDLDTGSVAAGVKYFGEAATTGRLTATATANYAVGWTVEATRLVVRIGNRAVAA